MINVRVKQGGKRQHLADKTINSAEPTHGNYTTLTLGPPTKFCKNHLLNKYNQELVFSSTQKERAESRDGGQPMREQTQKI